MPSTYETKEPRTAHLEIEVPAAEFKQSLQKSFRKNARYFNVHGFRKGKAPYPVVVNYYGEEVLHEDALDDAMPAAFDEAVKEHDLKVYSEPHIISYNVEPTDEGSALRFVAEFALEPVVKLGEYKGLEAYRPSVEVSEEEIDRKIEEARAKVSRRVPVEGRPIEKDDTVTIDYLGLHNEEPFDGGSAENYKLKIGSGTFIPGFEDGIIGREVGESFDLPLTFPEEYHAENLAGQDVVFKVDLKEAHYEELPDVDDEFVKDVSETSDTVAEYRDELRAELAETKEKEADHVFDDHILEQLADVSEIEMSDYMVEDAVNREIERQSRSFAMYGMTFDSFLQATGQTIGQVRAQMAPGAKKSLVYRYLLKALTEAEQPDVTDEEVEAKIAEIAEQYHQTAEEFKEKNLKEDADRDYLIQAMKEEKIMEQMRSWSTPTDVDPHAHEHEHDHEHGETCDHDHEHGEACDHEDESDEATD